MYRSNTLKTVSLIPFVIKISIQKLDFPGKDYREAPLWVKRKKPQRVWSVRPAGTHDHLHAVVNGRLHQHGFFWRIIFRPIARWAGQSNFYYRYKKRLWNRGRISPIYMYKALFFSIQYEIKMQSSINCNPGSWLHITQAKRIIFDLPERVP